MRVFISYSLNDQEQFVLSVLAKKLREQGYIVSTGYNIPSQFQNQQNLSQISNSNLFIGLITNTGQANNHVLKEWEQAKTKKIPSLLLIENTVRINAPYQNDPNIVVFNRYNPEPSIELIRQKIHSSKEVEKTGDESTAWIIGGLAALALIALLANEK